VHPSLFPFQADLTRGAIRRGRAAVMADTGLGKTRIQVEWSRLVTSERALILCPLAVARQTAREAALLGVGATVARDRAEALRGERLTISTYERLARLDPGDYDAVALDESQILKAFGGSTRRALIDAFVGTRYRLACSATPAPNDVLELGGHSEFLGVLPHRLTVARWFVPDKARTGNHRLKGHAEADFWSWVASWAAACRRPSDIDPSYDDSPFELPALEWWHHPLGPERPSPSATRLWAEKRLTLAERCERAAEIVASRPRRPWVVWCDSNEESRLLARLVPGAVEVRGDMPTESKEERLLAFTDGEARAIVTKASIAGLGLNWQHCSDFVLVGLNYSFERMYQLARRLWRFGQSRTVRGHLVVAGAERGVVEALERKREEHERTAEEMVLATRRSRVPSSPVELPAASSEVAEGPGWRLLLGDSVEALRQVEAGSVDLSIYSPPFANLYAYSDDRRDMGNSEGREQFLEHYRFLLPELLRVTRPGRLCAVHCRDLPLYAHRDGRAGLYDFPGALVREHESAGWTFHSRITIRKDPKTEAVRTWNHGLLHKNFAARAEVCRQATPDQVLVFRLWARDQEGEHVRHDLGQRSIEVWRRYAEPIWTDIDATDVLPYLGAREKRDERHIAPLQLGVVERCVELWSNPGELVLSPFAGVGSELVVSIRLARRALGIELKRSYWEQAIRNLSSGTASRRARRRSGTPRTAASGRRGAAGRCS
jgi:DNA modification methylase